MIAKENSRKQLIHFLINRWIAISGLAALERVYIGMCKYAKDNGMAMPDKPPIIVARPCLQIDIIKRRIIEILPESHFIDYTYEAPAPLTTPDFVELYIADHHQLAGKVIELMERMKIT